MLTWFLYFACVWFGLAFLGGAVYRLLRLFFDGPAEEDKCVVITHLDDNDHKP